MIGSRGEAGQGLGSAVLGEAAGVAVAPRIESSVQPVGIAAGGERAVVAGGGRDHPLAGAQLGR